jgi:hypothetical protein
MKRTRPSLAIPQFWKRSFTTPALDTVDVVLPAGRGMTASVEPASINNALVEAAFAVPMMNWSSWSLLQSQTTLWQLVYATRSSSLSTRYNGSDISR